VPFKIPVTSVISMHRPNKTERSVEQGDTHIGRSKGRRTNSGGDEQAFGAATNKLSQPSVRTVRVHHSKCVATAGEMEMDVDVDVDEDAISSMWSSASTNNKAEALLSGKLRTIPSNFRYEKLEKFSNFPLGWVHC